MSRSHQEVCCDGHMEQGPGMKRNSLTMQRGTDQQLRSASAPRPTVTQGEPTARTQLRPFPSQEPSVEKAPLPLSTCPCPLPSAQSLMGKPLLASLGRGNFH